MLEIRGRYTRELAQYVFDLNYSDIPVEIVEHVKRITLNQIGAALSGWTVCPGSEVFLVLSELGGSKEATVIGNNEKIPAPNAAAINATLAWAPMNDDTHVDSLLHSGHHSIHSAMSQAEVQGASGRDFVTAVVASNEVGIRIARAVSPAHNEKYNSSQLGFWSELRGPFCSSLATGKVLGLNAEQLGHTLGIAATSTSGLQALGESSPYSGTVYAWEAGKAVLNGMLAARLAEKGMTDGPEPLEGPLGWVRTYTQGHGRLDWLVKDLGTVFETGKIQLKTRCNSSMVHPLIDAAYELAKQYSIRPKQIEKITVRGQQWIKDYLWRLDVRTFQDAIFSLPFSIALVTLEPGMMTYPDQVLRRVGDPEIMALMSKMELEVDRDIKFSAEMSGAISFHMADGQTYHQDSVAKVRGAYPDRPLDPEELREKFRRLGRARLNAECLEQIINNIERMETLDHIGRLTEILRPSR